jgi:hypothetical protein
MFCSGGFGSDGLGLCASSGNRRVRVATGHEHVASRQARLAAYGGPWRGKKMRGTGVNRSEMGQYVAGNLRWGGVRGPSAGSGQVGPRNGRVKRGKIRGERSVHNGGGRAAARPYQHRTNSLLDAGTVGL